MTVLRESPWYQEILREGEARGEIRGEARGEARGERRGLISSIEINLDVKFGEDGLQLLPQINQISDTAELKEILRQIITAKSIEELRQLL
jgi:predicted transposase YdaD